MDLYSFITKISYWAIPALFAITLPQVAHGWMARLLGDRTGQMLGRLSLNPLRHIDAIGTVVVPLVLLAIGGSLVIFGPLAIGGPMVGWARPVPYSTSGMRRERSAVIAISLSGPLVNLLMAAVWCGIYAAIVRVNGQASMLRDTVVYWVAYMAQAGLVINVVLALFNALPIPPLDGGRIVAQFLPQRLRKRYEGIAPLGLYIALALSVCHGLEWLYQPAYRMIGRIITVLGAP